MESPATIVRRNVVAYLAAQATSLAALLYALRIGDIAGATVWACIIGIAGPFCLAYTVVETWRAWSTGYRAGSRRRQYTPQQAGW